MRTVAAVIAFVACVHAGLWALAQNHISAPNYDGQLASVSYSPFEGSVNPDANGKVSIERVRSDLKQLAPMTRAIRTYSSTGGVELVPAVAAENGLRVSVGAWLDKNKDRNEREIRNVIDLAKRHSNISSVVVGNETVYRDDIKVNELIQYIQRVKRNVSVPVTTGEIFSVWRDHPELVSAVDYMAVHILPYWNGVSEKSAVDTAIGEYEDLRRRYPGKRIVIAEFGWPSAGYNFKNANPGRIEQAVVLRDFVSRAEAYGIDYNIVEAIDQPWKFNEGGVGPYWGMLDASRHAKFEWTGTLTDPDHWRLAGVALLLSILLSLPILSASTVTVRQAVILSAAANGVGAWFAAVFAYWNGHYFLWGTAFALGLGTVLLIPLIVIALARVEEIAQIAFGRTPRRLINSPSLVPEGPTPKVSIHVPAYREPPEMLKQTLDALAALEYPNFEVVLVINNTPDPAMWKPIEEYCQVLGERFKFVREDNC
ncbi:MAG TPA: glycosyltransferase, partial [Pseudolabrys sp.]